MVPEKRPLKPTGSFELATPRDRNGYFEPQLVKKHQTTLSDELERKIIRLFALGMSYQDISREIEDLSPSVFPRLPSVRLPIKSFLS